MSNRYEPVTSDVENVLKDVREKYFPELGSAKILCVFDTHKRTKGSKVVLADIKKAGEFEKFLTMDEAGDEGYDYIIRIDLKAWELGTSQDRIRLIRHELRHTLVDTDAKKPWKLREHSIEDFYSEIQLNSDNPRWSQELSGKVMSAYEENKE
jgi:hypothetical protein